MKYRRLGKIDRMVSEVGLGCEHLDGKPYEQVVETIDEALEQGVNIIDVFMPGTQVRENIAKALGKRRGQVMVHGHIGACDLKQQYDLSREMGTVKKYFEEILRLFGGYIDLGMMFFIDSEDDYRGVFETEFVSYVQRLKKQGDILHIGFSSHNPKIAIKAIQTGVPEMMMFSISPVFDMLPSDIYILDNLESGVGTDLIRGVNPDRAELYKLCEKNGIGITSIKSFGGGKLLSNDFTPFPTPLTPVQCIHYALSRPAVASVLPGCKNAAEVREAVRYFDAGDDEKDYSGVLGSAQNDFRGNCLYCSHCHPCVSEIDIAAVHRCLDIARLDIANISPMTRQQYINLDIKAGECIECGNCEKRCPFGVRIIENMKEAAALFGE